MMRSFVGSPLYTAPEIIATDNYCNKCDIWSIGILTYYLLCGQEPFLDINQDKLNLKIINGKFNFDQDQFNSIGKTARQFISQLLQTNPSKRISAEQALSHPWLKVPILDIKDKHYSIQDRRLLRKQLTNFIRYQNLNRF